jgi:hypothetical protein
MLRDGRSRVPFPMRLLDFSVVLILPAALWPRSRLSLYQKWVPGVFLGLLTSPSVSRLSRKCGSLESHNPMALHGVLQGELYLFLPLRLKSYVSWDVTPYISLTAEVSEECVVSIFRIEKWAKQETSMKEAASSWRFLTSPGSDVFFGSFCWLGGLDDPISQKRDFCVTAPMNLTSSKVCFLE